MVGFAGGLRRSEIVGLNCEPEDLLDGLGWVAFVDDGLLLTLRGKTRWREVEIGRGASEATCPVAALKRWLAFAKLSRGPVFRRVQGGKACAERLSDRHVARFVKRLAAAGLRGDLPEAERAALRAGRGRAANLTAR